MRDILDHAVAEIRGSWRFRRAAMVTAWIVCAAGWLAVLTLPDIYQAKSRFYVDAESRLAAVMSDVGVAMSVGSQVFVVQQAMLERPQLEKVAKETGLALRAQTPEEFEALLESLKARLAVSTGRANEARDLYTITFEDQDREMAVAVVRSLLKAFVDDVLQLKEAGGHEVAGYLDEQKAHYASLLSTAESNLAEFKKKHVGLLPGESGGIFERLQVEMDKLSQLSFDLQTEEDRRDELRRQLQSTDPYAPDATLGTTGAALPVSPTDASIEELEKSRAQLLLQFTDKHPDVIAATEQLERLYAKRNEERVARAAAASATGGVSNSTNPVYQSVQIALNEAGVGIAALRSQKENQANVVALLRGQVNTIPEIEAEYTQLTRNYDQYRELYAEIMLKSERERMGNAGEQREVVNFNIIDPPSAPLDPVAPPRGLFLLIVLFAGLGIGGGVAFILHQLNPVFHDVKSLQRVINRPVLGTVSLMWMDLHRTERRGRIAAFAAGCAGLFVIFGITLVFQEQGVQAIREMTAQIASQGKVSQ